MHEKMHRCLKKERMKNKKIERKKRKKEVYTSDFFDGLSGVSKKQNKIQNIKEENKIRK